MVYKIFFLLILVLSLHRDGVVGDYDTTPTTDLAEYTPIKGCTLEAVYYAATFLANKCRYVNPPSCFQLFGQCILKKGFNATAAVEQCAQELGRPFDEVVEQNCNVSAPAYLLSLQASCCSKTKLVAQIPGTTLDQFEALAETCYAKDKCGNDRCP